MSRRAFIPRAWGPSHPGWDKALKPAGTVAVASHRAPCARCGGTDIVKKSRDRGRAKSHILHCGACGHESSRYTFHVEQIDAIWNQSNEATEW